MWAFSQHGGQLPPEGVSQETLCGSLSLKGTWPYFCHSRSEQSQSHSSAWNPRVGNRDPQSEVTVAVFLESLQDLETSGVMSWKLPILSLLTSKCLGPFIQTCFIEVQPLPLKLPPLSEGCVSSSFHFLCPCGINLLRCLLANHPFCFVAFDLKQMASSLVFNSCICRVLCRLLSS